MSDAQLLKLSERGKTFATRERAAAMVDDIGAGRRAEVDFSGVRAASPSFIDALLSGLADQFERIDVVCLPEALEPLVDRVVSRRKLEKRVKVVAVA